MIFKAGLVGFLVLLFFHTVFLLSIMTKQHNLEMILSGSAAGISNLSNIFRLNQPTKPSPVVENLTDSVKNDIPKLNESIQQKIFF